MNKYQKILLIMLLCTAVALHGVRWVWAERQHLQWQNKQEAYRAEIEPLRTDGPPSLPLESIRRAPEQESRTVTRATQSDAEAPVEVEKHCELVHINTASAVALQVLPGIGPSYAANIIEERNQQPFLYTEELLRVRGIGPIRLEAIRPLICLHLPQENAKE